MQFATESKNESDYLTHETVDRWLDNDEISIEEEGFLKGYLDESNIGFERDYEY